MRHHLGRQADADAGGRIDHDAPAVFLFVIAGGGEQAGSFGVGQHAGNLALDALLIILDGGDQRIFAVARSGIIAGPQQRGLHLLTVGNRNAGE